MVRKAVVTGGSNGLGLAIVRALLANDYAVSILDRVSPREPFPEDTGQPHMIVVDLIDTSAVFEAFDESASILGGIDVLVNNAAIYPNYDLIETEFGVIEQKFRETFDVNVLGTARCSHAALPYLQQSDSGRVINFSSVSVDIGSPTRLESYIASKGAIVALTKIHARVLGEFGITVNAVLPGSFSTLSEINMTEDEAASWHEYLMGEQVIQRRGQVEEVGALCAYLASPDAGFITGQCIRIDGGWAL